jgi:hypothetical protein
MRPWSLHCLLMAFVVCFILPAAAEAQVIPFAGNFGQGLAPSDNQMIFQSVTQLDAVEPSHTSGVPLGWHGLPPGAPSHCRRKATASRLPLHLVPHAERRMEDQELIQPRDAASFRREDSPERNNVV